MAAIKEKKINYVFRIGWLSAAICLLAGSLLCAGVLISSGYTLSVPVLANGGANTTSLGYRIRTGILGQCMTGSAGSHNYNNLGGVVNQPTVVVTVSSVKLGDVYVYPNPFKPNSSASFRADKITFKYLPAEATIRIFAITGKQVAELHKTDKTVDYYEWNAVNSDGRKLASGIYIYFIKAPGGGRTKGKFAVIR